LFSLALLAGCVGQSPTLPTQQPHTLVVGATLEPPTMNPSASPAASIPQVLLYNVYETLVKMDPEGNLTPKGHSKLWQIGLLEHWLQTHRI
jgi:peptide/nickel transport system substrate-binding protein